MLLFFLFSFIILSFSINTTKIAFGSCADFFKHSPSRDIFQAVLSTSPSIFLWIGDLAYYKQPSDFLSTSKQINANLQRASYQELIKKAPINGVWDDHDFGRNDEDKRNPYKHIIRDLFLDFLEKSTSHSKIQSSVSLFDRKFKNYGIYDSILIDEKVKIILLDCRWNKDERFGNGSDMLGEEQWLWLEKELSDQKGELVLIISGTQILPQNRLFNPFIPESWYDESRERLFALIKNTGRKGVIFLSGDVHYGEILLFPNSCHSKIGYPLYEMTSSGMTHHLGESWKQKFYDLIVPDTYNNYQKRFFGLNFGLVEVEWQEEILKSIINLQIRDFEGKIRIEEKIRLEDLGWKKMDKYNGTESCQLEIWRGWLFIENFLRKYKGFYWITGIIVLLVGVFIHKFVFKKEMEFYLKRD
jgi:alkaline phosphatase D